LVRYLTRVICQMKIQEYNQFSKEEDEHLLYHTEDNSDQQH